MQLIKVYLVLLAIITFFSFAAKPVEADANIDIFSQSFSADSHASQLAQASQDETLLSDQVASSPDSTVGSVLGIDYNNFPPEGFADSLIPYINSILTIVIVIALALVLFAFISAGFSWITAGGDKSKTDEARNKIVNAVIGMVIVSASFALLRFVSYFLGFESFLDAVNNIIPIG